MLVDQVELYRRFADYDDEVLWHILTVERAQYRGEALAAAEMVLRHRGVTPPAQHQGAREPPPAAQAPAPARPKTPYQFVDVVFDALLFGLVCWALRKLWGWTGMPFAGLWGELAFLMLTLGLLEAAVSLRRRWRAKEWN